LVIKFKLIGRVLLVLGILYYSLKPSVTAMPRAFSKTAPSVVNLISKNHNQTIANRCSFFDHEKKEINTNNRWFIFSGSKCPVQFKIVMISSIGRPIHPLPARSSNPLALRI